MKLEQAMLNFFIITQGESTTYVCIRIHVLASCYCLYGDIKVPKLAFYHTFEGGIM